MLKFDRLASRAQAIGEPSLFRTWATRLGPDGLTNRVLSRRPCAQ
jgi:hypothetical protein